MLFNSENKQGMGGALTMGGGERGREKEGEKEGSKVIRM